MGIWRLNEPFHEKTCSRGFLTKSDTNSAVKPQKMARDLKFRIEEVEDETKTMALTSCTVSAGFLMTRFI